MLYSQKTSRRQFIKTTAAIASPLPFILPAQIRAAKTKPNDRITMGFVGLGKQNHYLLNVFLKLPDTQVVAVCEVDRTRRNDAKSRVEKFYGAQKSGGRYRGCDVYHDFRDLVRREDIDAVCIATPDHWHALICLDAAEHGKDIYCEKPLCKSIHEARAVVNAVRRNQRVLQTGSMQRSYREFRTACELVRNGVIGDIRRVDVAVGGPAKWCDLPAEEMEPGLDWNMWLGPAPKRPYNSVLSPRGVHNHFPAWRDYREYGGGGVTDWGAHHFDIAQWGLGMDASGPREIYPVEDPHAVSGVWMVYSQGTQVNHVAGNGVTFYGSAGKIYVNRGRFKLWIGNREAASSKRDLDRVEARYLADAKVRLYKSDNHKQDFLNSVRSRGRPAADVEIGARTATVCHLVNLAYYHQKSMKWDPVHERFLPGYGEDAWRNVPHRSPWTLT